MQQIELTIQKEKLKVEGSLFRKYMASATVVNVLNGLIGMIPDEEGLSVVRAGLGFVFRVQSLTSFRCVVFKSHRYQLTGNAGMETTNRQQREGSGDSGRYP